MQGNAEAATDKRVARRLSTMRLQRVESAKLVEFPETVDGFFGKVRWYKPFFVLPSKLCPICPIESAMCGHTCTQYFWPGVHQK